jgi:hypothetical protein
MLNKLLDLLQEKVESIREEAVNEVKSYDRAHGAKLPHKIISQFFTDVAPKFDSLSAVEAALHALYKKNNIETTAQGIKQVISNYKKRVDLSKQSSTKTKPTTESIYNESAISGLTAQQRDAIIRSMKLNFKKVKSRIKDDDLAKMYVVANKMVGK